MAREVEINDGSCALCNLEEKHEEMGLESFVLPDANRQYNQVPTYEVGTYFHTEMSGGF